MSTPPVSDEDLAATVAAYTACDRNQSATAKAMGLARETVQSRLRRAAEKGMLLEHPAAMPGFAIKSVAAKVGDAWVKQTKEPGEVYAPIDGHAIKGESALVDAEGRVIQKWVKTREDSADTMALAAAIHTEFGQYKGFAKLVRPPRETYADLCNYYPIVDPHIGMLAHVKETGESNDLKIGVSRVGGTLHRLIGESPPAETGVIINTGDFFHADDQRNVTPASGHQLDVDGRSHKVKWAGVNMLRTTIDLALQRHKRVIVKNLKGNHDPESAMWLNIALGLFYANEERVEIDTEDANNDHFFHLFGVNYTGATHGHTMKPDRMYVMMAEDNPEYWNASLYRWCIFGHIHHETKKQIGSLICESFSQPVPRDSFAHAHGYRSGSAMQSVTLHRQDGESGRVIKRFPPSRGLQVAANDNEERKAAA
jgi:transposase